MDPTLKLTPLLWPPNSTFTACQGLHLLAPSAASAGHRLLSCTAVRLARLLLAQVQH
jgi:hypothetical protein